MKSLTLIVAGLIIGLIVYYVYDTLSYEDVCTQMEEGKLYDAIKLSPPRESGFIGQYTYGEYWPEGERFSPITGGQYIGYSINDPHKIIEIGNKTYFYKEPTCAKYQKQVRRQ